MHGPGGGKQTVVGNVSNMVLYNLVTQHLRHFLNNFLWLESQVKGTAYENP